MQEEKTLYVVDDEPAPLFRDSIPCSYWHARCEYAGRHNEHLQWALSRGIFSLYHADCYATVLMNSSKEDWLYAYLTAEHDAAYRTVWTDGLKKRGRVLNEWTYEQFLDIVHYRRGYCTQLGRFYSLESIRHFLRLHPHIPPWCQYCMQLFF